MSIGRLALVTTVVMLGFVAVLIAAHDLLLYRRWAFLPNEYCRVSQASSAERGVPAGQLTTEEADSGCIQGEVHLCGYQRFVLSEVIEVRQPCRRAVIAGALKTEL